MMTKMHAGGWEALGDDSNTVFVKGLDSGLSESVLRQGLLEAFGTCGAIRQVGSPGCKTA